MIWKIFDDPLKNTMDSPIEEITDKQIQEQTRDQIIHELNVSADEKSSNKNNTIKNNTMKNDTMKNNTMKNDTMKNNTMKNDTMKNDKIKKEVEVAPEFGLTYKKECDFSSWYTQLVIKSELLEYYDIKGCFIMRPWSYFIWNVIKKYFTEKIEKMGVEECYFPLLVTKQSMDKEKDFIESFAPELAWITKCGENDIEPVAIRPTSEAVMYPYFKKWLFSHRDLPMKLNQWCNVLRWEVKSTLPFIRGREFLWQEGHSSFYKKDEAEKEVLDILHLYKKIYEEFLAVPVIEGRKTENEKFGGADYTTTIETIINANGKSIQAATSHHLGQNFSKIYDISINNEQNETSYIYQNSWGLTTRCIGICIMVHSDNIGLVLPPQIAKWQVVIVPCGKQTDELNEYIARIEKDLQSKDIRVLTDNKANVQPGYKFNHWELKGIPLRLEIGKR
ncbi:Prolyl-tRNA synthetase, partial [Pseudoloma neurophilia]